jgi:hypothetical protein
VFLVLTVPFFLVPFHGSGSSPELQIDHESCTISNAPSFSLCGHVGGLYQNYGCVRFWNVREWNETVPFLGAVLVFGFGIE